MGKFSKEKKDRIQRNREKREEEKKEKQRLKTLPKPLRKLETDLGFYVDFMAVYDGYIGDFTGQIIPAEPVNNPFVIINEMELNFPHQNALNKEQKEQYVLAISEAFRRMGFYINLSENDKISELYELLFFYIITPTESKFNSITTINYKGNTVNIEKIELNKY